MIKIGDNVRLIGIPADLPEIDAETQTIFGKCLGREFTVHGFNEIGWAEIPVESVTSSAGEKIWVKPDCLELVSK